MANLRKIGRTMLLAAPLALMLAAQASAQTTGEIAQDKQIFADAQALSDQEGGHLWGRKLYGKMLLADPDTRAVVANEPDAQGILHAQDGVYIGTLPKDVIISNAPTDWEGARWTMLMLPTVPDETIARHIMLAHEMFHRIQPDLKLMAADTPCVELDTLEGRVWLELEWRALAAALVTTGAQQDAAIRDALAFRGQRQAMFPAARAAEASQEIAEGIPEFTGVMTGEPDVHAARWHAAANLAHPDTSVSFVRYFAYISGPAYGLLLDERMPGWRAKLTADSDLSAMLASTLHGKAKVDASARAQLYGASEIRATETERDAKVQADRARYRAALIDGPTLLLPAPGRFSFNPSTLMSLGDAGNVYPTFHAEAPWGTLDVKDGVLVPTDFSRATVAAPKNTNGPHLEGPGWTIDLAPGWSVVPAAEKSGSFMLKKG